MFRTCDPTQAHGAMSSPRSGPAKQNLQLAVASQNLQVVSSLLAAASAASAASATVRTTSTSSRLLLFWS